MSPAALRAEPDGGCSASITKTNTNYHNYFDTTRTVLN